MEITTFREQGVLVVEVTGRLDALTAPAYVERLRKELAGGAQRLVVDCAGVEYVSSAGLRAFLTIAKELTGKGGAEAFCRLPEQVREVFRVSGFVSIISIHDTRDAALATLA